MNLNKLKNYQETHHSDISIEVEIVLLFIVLKTKK